MRRASRPAGRILQVMRQACRHLLAVVSGFGLQDFCADNFFIIFSVPEPEEVLRDST
jgi:hypothetical protein